MLVQYDLNNIHLTSTEHLKFRDAIGLSIEFSCLTRNVNINKEDSDNSTWILTALPS